MWQIVLCVLLRVVRVEMAVNMMMEERGRFRFSTGVAPPFNTTYYFIHT